MQLQKRLGSLYVDIISSNNLSDVEASQISSEDTFSAHMCVYISPNAVISQCEQNPCENGGTCKKHALSYTCDCPPGYNGSLCENGKQITKRD